MDEHEERSGRICRLVFDLSASQNIMASAITTQKELLRDLEKMGIEFRRYQPNAMLSAIEIQPSIIDEIKAAEKEDNYL